MKMEPKMPRPQPNPTSRPPKAPKNRPVAQEVIDLDIEGDDRPTVSSTGSQQFVGELSRKCSSFFGWLSNPSSADLAQHLWKQHMLQQGQRRFPQLSLRQVQRIVERDWGYMNEQERNGIVQQFRRCPACGDLQLQLEHMQQIQQDLLQ